MKQLSLLPVILLCTIFSNHAQNNVGINDDNSTPKASAILDVYSTTKGLLVPRIALTATTTAAPVTTPEASLLVYNTATAGDVVPGYYYWNGTSAWVRLLVGTDSQAGLNLVTKSSNATLLKTETLVLASGDITLTLPAVTSADNGLAITIKNVGTYLDLVTVIPESTKTIDANTSLKLTRWHSQTYIVSGSDWVLKEKLTFEDNILTVCETGSFTTIAEVVAFLSAHMSGPMVVQLGETNSIASTQTISLPYPVTFQGMSYGEATINAAAGVSGSALFTCVTECYFKMLIFNAYANTTGNDAIRFTGSGMYHEVKDCVFVGFNKGIVCSNNTDLWAFENDFEHCAGAGIEIAAGTASGGRLRVSETDFVHCAKGINLLSGVAEIVSIINCSFYNTTSGSDIGILYAPDTFTSFASMLISHNGWNNAGTYISGFDFTRADGRDADAFVINNAGSENKNPHCKIGVQNNTATTTVTTALTFYRANWINTSTYTCKWTIGTTSPVNGNRITYQPVNLMDAWCIISGNLSVNDNKIITIAVVKNGVTTTRYGETDLRIPSTNSAYQFSTVIYVPDMKPGEYLELYVTSTSNNDVVTFRDLQWFTNTQ